MAKIHLGLIVSGVDEELKNADKNINTWVTSHIWKLEKVAIDLPTL